MRISVIWGELLSLIFRNSSSLLQVRQFSSEAEHIKVWVNYCQCRMKDKREDAPDSKFKIKPVDMYGKWQ
ncbi:hypothetical protein V6N12_040695 [Hibiscus sabdariffa]|uniref:Uncharacterized protein n=1 Tax=Hibiscus sabdariffa TaxID=183260 RepID=A0ABR2E4J0_9ROSI